MGTNQVMKNNLQSFMSNQVMQQYIRKMEMLINDWGEK
jgi:hypothetical protein